MSELSVLINQFEEPEDVLKNEAENPSVLIVDDDESMRRGITSALSNRFRVVAASNGREGITLFDENVIFAAVLDIKMTGMSGFEVCQELNKKNPDLPIIFYTAFQGEHDLQSILNIYRPFAYLDKGGDYDLPETVQNAVERYKDILKRIQSQEDLFGNHLDIKNPIKNLEADDLVNIPNVIGKERINFNGIITNKKAYATWRHSAPAKFRSNMPPFFDLRS